MNTQGKIKMPPTKYAALDAKGCIRRYWRLRLCSAACAVAVVFLIMAVFLGMLDGMGRLGLAGFGLYMLLLLLVLAGEVSTMTRVDKSLNEILYTDCDPEKFLKILELRKKRKGSRSFERLLYQQEFGALTYLGDWDAVYERTRGYEPPKGKRKRIFQYNYLSALGSASLMRGETERYEACREQLKRLPAQYGTPKDQKLLEPIFLGWERRECQIRGEAGRERELLEEILEKSPNLAQRVLHTFRLAELALSEEERGEAPDGAELQKAKERLEFAAAYGNTLPERAKAEKLLKERKW